ncbi:sigma-54-dependent Fis family transcriptional regulator [Paludisphaera mucosa]|uniref:Sigma 54-interacting transcriptional regulator n=1 Tax=Paludisphaera mucosa TaxID=3030827 RepID=A0ABT6FIS0_9BACT|nr:sigma 54-interacting transcriptional regulator [Paludisphaera mucosa]MDG3007467.1 sigma 54-interacting transcriptional regulator [Paludisphaera mucosa]
MNDIGPLLLTIWRVVSRHRTLTESLEETVPLLADHLSLEVAAIRSVDRAGGCLETVAFKRIGESDGRADARTPVAAEILARLGHWCERDEILVEDLRAFSARFPGLAPVGLEGAILAAPLNPEEGAPAILLLAPRPPHRFAPEHVELVRALVDPLTVAVENDHRLRELVKLREAAEAENRTLRSKLDREDVADSIIGAGTGLREVMEQIELVSTSDAPVLILGETGSGKEVVARAIHTRSRRASGPFLRVNCGAIPSELVDSELFGHEKGSFTGAVGERKGWFERADGGTLFLDECGELPPAAQVRLLRILQDGCFERVGGEKPRRVDVRIVAATHRDLHAMVHDGRFRQDLWYRLAVFPVHLPPLRDRLADVPAMAAHFAHRAAKRLGFHHLSPTADDIGLLVQYPWPGNVRELAAVIERAAILGNGAGLDVVRALGVPAGLRPQTASPTRAASSAALDPLPTLDQAAARHIEQALIRTGGRIEGSRGAAAILDVNPHTLRSRMRKLGVDWERYRQDAMPQPFVAARVSASPTQP